MPGLQGYSPADLARLRTVQANPGTSAPVVREHRQGLRLVRVVRRRTESGAIVTTRERPAGMDVHVRAPLVVGRLS